MLAITRLAMDLEGAGGSSLSYGGRSQESEPAPPGSDLRRRYRQATTFPPPCTDRIPVPVHWLNDSTTVGAEVPYNPPESRAEYASWGDDSRDSTPPRMLRHAGACVLSDKTQAVTSASDSAGKQRLKCRSDPKHHSSSVHPSLLLMHQ
jgi:hypothetical protein